MSTLSANYVYSWKSPINLAWFIFFAFQFVYLMTVQPLVCGSRKTRSHGPNAKRKPKSQLTIKHGILKPVDAGTSTPPTQTNVQDQAVGKLNVSTPGTPNSADDNKLKKDTSIATKEENKPVQSIALISGRKIPSAKKTGKTTREKQSVEQHIPETTKTPASLAKGSVCRNKDESGTQASGGKTKGSTQQTLADTQTCDKLLKMSIDKGMNGGYKVNDETKILQIGDESEEDSDATLKDVRSLIKDPNQPQTIEE